MASENATAATGRTKEGWYTGSAVDGSVVTSEESPTIRKYGTSRKGNKIDLREKEATAVGEETTIVTAD